MRDNMTIFHAAPEDCYSRKFRNEAHITYFPVDLEPTDDFVKKWICKILNIMTTHLTW